MSFSDCERVCPCKNGGFCLDPHLYYSNTTANAPLCLCQPGFTGQLCELHCEPTHFGLNCGQECQCENKGICNTVTGSCTCPNGFYGGKLVLNRIPMQKLITFRYKNVSLVSFNAILQQGSNQLQ